MTAGIIRAAANRFDEIREQDQRADCVKLFPARLLPAGPDNPKGYFEPDQIITIHNRFLAAARTNWFSFERIPEESFHSAETALFADELLID